jgi:hypothetical protein
MRDQSAVFALGKRDVIGAWLVCLVFAVGSFALLAAAHPSEPNGWFAALDNPGPTVTVAVAADRQGRC